MITRRSETNHFLNVQSLKKVSKIRIKKKDKAIKIFIYL